MLRMTREEIGSFLGLKLETVSRTFSRFQPTASSSCASARSRSPTPSACSSCSTAPPCDRGLAGVASTPAAPAGRHYSSSGTMSMAPHGHSATHMPQPLQ
ncbi:MAG TPA: helix-turn-helix domain-containing protein [Caldimonas sp.]